MHRGGGREPHRLADLAHRRRVALLALMGSDEVENLSPLAGELGVGQVPAPLSIVSGPSLLVHRPLDGDRTRISRYPVSLPECKHLFDPDPLTSNGRSGEMKGTDVRYPHEEGPLMVQTAAPARQPTSRRSAARHLTVYRPATLRVPGGRRRGDRLPDPTESPYRSGPPSRRGPPSHRGPASRRGSLRPPLGPDRLPPPAPARRRSVPSVDRSCADPGPAHPGRHRWWPPHHHRCCRR